MSTSKSRSSSSNSATTYDQRTTESINAGIGGDIEDANVVSGVRGDVNVSVTDGGAIEAAASASRAAAEAVTDTAKNAFGFGEDALDFASDSMGFAGDALDGAIDAVQESTESAFAFGENAFDAVQGAADSAFNAIDDAQSNAYSFAGDALDANTGILQDAMVFGGDLLDSVLTYNAEQQSEVLDASTKLTELSMANLAAIKSGETIAKAADRNLLEMKNGLIVVAAITAAAVVGSKFIRGEK
ncbi:hypothetical protein [Microbulbifer sp. ARAS458-1]|uniref:hypothetical protein n=1 Tax=Microbulbifer sp. ARAS458-1 TaxID=3140242 RepID=UPI0038782DE8